MKEFVILVDEDDQELGQMEKLQAHKEAKLHRALSVFVLNENGEMLIQKRALQKYHSAGLWSNACCSHPRPQEDVKDAAIRRLEEEIGLNSFDMEKAFSFVYRANFENGLTEYEFDHVFLAYSNQEPTLNLEEVSEVKYVELASLQKDMADNEEQYTFWFKKAMPDLLNYLNSKK